MYAVYQLLVCLRCIGYGYAVALMHELEACIYFKKACLGYSFARNFCVVERLFRLNGAGVCFPL